MVTVAKLSPTQKRIYQFLQDRRPHKITDVIKLLNNPLVCRQTVWCHVWMLRKKLKGYGETVIFEYIGDVSHYRLIDYHEGIDDPV